MADLISTEEDYQVCVDDALKLYSTDCEDAKAPKKCRGRAKKRHTAVYDDFECLLTETCECKQCEKIIKIDDEEEEDE